MIQACNFVMILLAAASGTAASPAHHDEPPPRKAAPARVANERTLRPLMAAASARVSAARISQRHEDYKIAADAVRLALAEDPENPAARSMLAITLAGTHEFTKALEVARSVAATNPHIVMNHGIITDCLVELGRYDEAIEAAQRMVDLKPCSASLLRVSYLRSLYGDSEGALELLTECADAAASTGDLAWIQLQIGNEQLASGRADRALESYQRANAIHPGIRSVELAIARTLFSLGRISESSNALQKMIRLGADPDAHVLLAEILQVMGDAVESGKHYEIAARLEQAELDAGANEWHHLVDLAIRRPGRGKEALDLARREAAVRFDIFTYARLARAEFINGNLAAAVNAARKSLRTGSKDPFILATAGEIYLQPGAGETKSNSEMLQMEGRGLLREALARKAGLTPLLAKNIEAVAAANSIK